MVVTTSFMWMSHKGPFRPRLVISAFANIIVFRPLQIVSSLFLRKRRSSLIYTPNDVQYIQSVVPDGGVLRAIQYRPEPLLRVILHAASAVICPSWARSWDWWLAYWKVSGTWCFSTSKCWTIPGIRSSGSLPSSMGCSQGRRRIGGCRPRRAT